MKLRIFALAPVWLFILAGCQPSPPAPTKPQPICAGGDMMMQTTLWFTTSKPEGWHISSLAWQGFVDKEIAPYFKQGLSVYDTKSQRQGEDGQLIRENRKALVLIHGVDQEDNTHIKALRERYQKQFSTPAVIRVDSPACVGL